MQLAEALHEVAEARAADPLRPVTFVAPTRLAALAMRRELARLTPHAAVRFETATSRPDGVVEILAAVPAMNPFPLFPL